MSKHKRAEKRLKRADEKRRITNPSQLGKNKRQV